MEFLPFPIWQHLGSVLVITTLIKVLGPKFFRPTLSTFDDLTDKKRKAFVLELVFFLGASVSSFYLLYLIVFGGNPIQDQTGSSALDKWLLFSGGEGLFAGLRWKVIFPFLYPVFEVDTVFRLMWRLNPVQPALIHGAYVLLMTFLLLPVDKTILHFCSLRIMTIIPSPLFILKNMMGRLELDYWSLCLGVKLVGFFCEFHIRIVTIPIYYILLFTMAETSRGLFLSYYSVRFWLAFGVAVDLMNIYYFICICKFYWNEIYIQKRKKNTQTHRAARVQTRRR
ncbi:uncharacterized protein LOC143449566 [Clavelina lepadiformis]|uniref:uncharacterized protein LOC143449566 n=1 Tax=Clavelina lepadiformis TaxID=159417 RepID=UPI004042DF43